MRLSGVALFITSLVKNSAKVVKVGNHCGGCIGYKEKEVAPDWLDGQRN